MASEKSWEFDELTSMSHDKLDKLALIKKLNSGGKFHKEERLFCINQSYLEDQFYL